MPFLKFLNEIERYLQVANFLSRHARTYLPKYAVPVFIRHIKERSATHNNKQDKVPLKKAGIDPGQMEGNPVLWVSDHGKGDDYVPFTQNELDLLNAGRAKL